MPYLRKTVAVLIVGLWILAQAPTGAQAQQAAPSPAPSSPAPASSSFDPYWLVTVGASSLGGWVIAGLLTDGLIIPAYFVTAAPQAMAGGARTAAAVGPQMGARMAGPAMATATAAGSAMVSTVQLVGRATGAVVGGLLADAWYR